MHNLIFQSFLASGHAILATLVPIYSRKLGKTETGQYAKRDRLVIPDAAGIGLGDQCSLEDNGGSGPGR